MRRAIVPLLLLLAGCSSPPPVPVEWDKPATPMNSQLPQWRANDHVVAAPVLTDRWATVVNNFRDDDTEWSPEVYYAVAHSPRIVVTAPGGAAFFTAKRWLRKHGVKGVIEYRPQNNCLTCRENTIYLSR